MILFLPLIDFIVNMPLSANFCQVGHSWRVSPDVFAIWDHAEAQTLHLPNFLISVSEAVETAQQYAKYAGPGGFNDADMLVVGLDGMYPYGVVEKCPPHVKGCKKGDYISREQWGRVGGLSHSQQQAHFSLYCMLASPLILGNDPRRMSKATVGILTAREVLAVHQDTLGQQALRVSSWVNGWR
jgi:alpha-galactosidase